MKTRNFECNSFLFLKHFVHNVNISNLDIDSKSLFFDYLPLQGLIKYAMLNKQCLDEAGQYFRYNFQARVQYGQSGNIYSESDQLQINTFKPFVRSILIENVDLKNFQSERFTNLSEIEFIGSRLGSTAKVWGVLANIDTLKFIDCQLDRDFHASFLNITKRLKRLYIRDSDSPYILGTTNVWLTKTYPALKQFELNSQRVTNKVIKFLEINSNICHFSTSIEFLIANMNSLLASQVKLDVLSILHGYTKIGVAQFETFVSQLNKLREKKLFINLHLYYFFPQNDYIYPIKALSLTTVMHKTFDFHSFSLSRLGNLEELYVNCVCQLNDVREVELLTTLRYVYINQDEINNILPFIRLKTLRKITLYSVGEGPHFNRASKIIDLSVLNKEREMATNNKLTVYVQEKVYLATKYANKEKNHHLIEIKRIQSYDGGHDFGAGNGALASPI